MAGLPLDPDEWESVLGKLIRYHFNISKEITELIAQIRKEMKEELVPKAEERATYGKIVKQGIRCMWGLEYEIEDLQTDFAKQLGSMDLDNLTDDFVEEALLQSKPLQGVLKAIRVRQKEKMEELKKLYGENIKDLEPMKVPRPPKPEPKPESEKKAEGQAKPAAEGEAKPAEGEAKPAAEGEPKPAEGEAKPAEEEAKPAEEEAKPAEEAPAPVVEPPPAEPGPAVEAAAAPAAVEASA